MAKSLAERLTAAKSPRARLADNEALLAELKAERDRLSAARDQSAGQSIDFALSEDDRDDAAAKAARYERTFKGLEAEIAGLATLIEERRDQEAADRIEAERAAVRAERDALAAEFGVKVPGIVAQLTDLFGRVKANGECLIAMGDLNGCAEAKARGVIGFVDPFGPKQFTKMIIPDFHGRERAWPPIERPFAVQDDYGASIERARVQRVKDADSKRKAAEAYACDHGRYELATPFTDYTSVRLPVELVAENGNLPAAVSNGDPWRGMLPHALIEELRKVPNLKVTNIDQAKRK